MAFLSQTEIGLKPVGGPAEIPNNPTAKLMYYLNSICDVLDMNDNADINRLQRYQQYHLLSHQDQIVLLQLCDLLKPNNLLDKCIFQSDALCGDSSNQFYELEAVRNNVFVAGNILIGGRNRQVTKVMAFKSMWLNYYYYGPFEEIAEQKRREEAEEQQRKARIAEQERQARIAEQQRIAEQERQARIAEQQRIAEQERQARIAEQQRIAEQERQARIGAEQQRQARMIVEQQKRTWMAEQQCQARRAEQRRQEERSKTCTIL